MAIVDTHHCQASMLVRQSLLLLCDWLTSSFGKIFIYLPRIQNRLIAVTHGRGFINPPV